MKTTVISELICLNRCPLCAEDLKDKGSYTRCTSCCFCVSHGKIDHENGIAVIVVDNYEEEE